MAKRPFEVDQRTEKELSEEQSADLYSSEDDLYSENWSNENDWSDSDDWSDKEDKMSSDLTTSEEEDDGKGPQCPLRQEVKRKVKERRRAIRSKNRKRRRLENGIMSTASESHKDFVWQTLESTQRDLQLEERRQAKMMTQQAEFYSQWIQQKRQLADTSRTVLGAIADLVQVVRLKRGQEAQGLQESTLERIRETYCTEVERQWRLKEEEMKKLMAAEEVARMKIIRGCEKK
ncbi:uncharacterized protein LOC134459020 [Engraulis encrasicolus]|uniref:uncharacterized protein LOC134459020 n=1 Tax=Engraulis encrasicolus TaxID=184585 RepID=UPI002FD789AD